MSQRNQRSAGLELDGLTHWLISGAAGLAPKCVSSRLEEEWLADSQCRSTALSKLRFALGCWWASVVIMSEYSRDRIAEASPVAAPIPAAAAGGFGTFSERNVGYVSLRSGTLFLIVGIYAALFCGLTTTLLHTRGLTVPAYSQSRGLDAESTEVEIIRLVPAQR